MTRSNNYFPTKPHFCSPGCLLWWENSFSFIYEAKKQRERRFFFTILVLLFQGYFNIVYFYSFHTYNLLLVDGGSSHYKVYEMAKNWVFKRVWLFWHGNNLISRPFSLLLLNEPLSPPETSANYFQLNIFFSSSFAFFCEKLFQVNKFLLVILVIIVAEVWWWKIKFREMFFGWWAFKKVRARAYCIYGH